MNHYDKQILESRQEEERQRHTTLETGIYVDDELITFAQTTLPDTRIQLFLPEQFVAMPDQVRDLKYPSRYAPDFIVTSLDTTVNFGFNILPVQLGEGGTKAMSSQFQEALRNLNPSIRISECEDNTETDKGNGAVLRCNQAMTDDFDYADGTVVLENKADEVCDIILDVHENPVYEDPESMTINNKIYATVKDTIKYVNISPPKCN